MTVMEWKIKTEICIGRTTIENFVDMPEIAYDIVFLNCFGKHLLLNFQECFKQCKDEWHFDNHRRHHEKKLKDESVVCDICDKSVLKYHIKKHYERKHADKNDNNFKCEKCSFGTNLKKYLYSHIKQCHSEMKSCFKCNTCGREFKVKKSYDKHLEYNEGKCKPRINKVDPGICPHCGEHFNLIQQHIMYKHATEKPFKCTKCDFAHALKKGLDMHMRTTHAEKSTLKICHICSYKTYTNQALRQHIEVVHEKIKNISCSQEGCDLKFHRKSTMVNHFMLKHSNEKPHKCEVCEEAFAVPSKLRTHKEKVHEGKKHPCEICAKVYSCPKRLKGHKFDAHGIEKKRKFKFDDA